VPVAGVEVAVHDCVGQAEVGQHLPPPGPGTAVELIVGLVGQMTDSIRPA